MQIKDNSDRMRTLGGRGMLLGLFLVVGVVKMCVWGVTIIVTVNLQTKDTLGTIQSHALAGSLSLGCVQPVVPS